MIFIDKKSRGYTLLFAVLVSALVLGVGVSILNIARKELLLNSSARESQYAFYAADTGYECAAYWEGQGGFSTSTPVSSVKCGTLADGTLASSTVMTTLPDGGPYTFTFNLPIAGHACAQVTIVKTFGNITLPNGGGTIVGLSSRLLSNGYNIGWNATGGVNDCSKIDPTKVERALLVTY